MRLGESIFIVHRPRRSFSSDDVRLADIAVRPSHSITRHPPHLSRMLYSIKDVMIDKNE